MKEYFEQVNGMIDTTVELLPKKKSSSYSFEAAMTIGSLSGLITTATLYKSTDKLTDIEYKKLINKINRKIERL